MSEQPATPSKPAGQVHSIDPWGQSYADLGAAVTAELMIGFWFDVVVMDLESDLFLNSALPMFTCELYYRFGPLLAPLSVELITSRHYISEHGIKKEVDRSDE